MNYGERLREYRQNVGITQGEVALELHYTSASQVSRYESGKLKLSRRKFAEALAAIERIVERRGKPADPAAMLEAT